MLVRCRRCGGAKKVVGMGYIQEDCPACGGAGYVAKKEEKEIEEPKAKSKKG